MGNRTTAAGLVADFLEIREPVKNDEHANIILAVFLQYLLDGNRYCDAATLLWTPSLFASEPRSVKMLFDAMFQNVSVMVPGAASMGKSYSLGVWHYLDWRRDPNYTNIQVVGPSEKHLERNLFSHLVKLHRQSSVPGPGEVVQLGITLDPHERSSGIFGVVVPIGKKSSGRLQGVKVVQRPTPHPQFGPLTRLRVILEEAENIPVGIFEDVSNILSNARGLEQFKIVAPFNPKDPNGACAQRCEPVDGWLSLDIDESETWISKRGWTVVRLDAYKSENVVQGQEIFFGMQTKEGLEKLIQNAGGVGTPGYYTMARGWFPPQGVDLAVIPGHLMHEIFGEMSFVDQATPVGALDVALEGGDNAIYILGRRGIANGWRRPAKPEQKEGEFVPFVDSLGKRTRRPVVQVDQIFILQKGDTTSLVEQTKKTSVGAGVRGEDLGIDRTGNGAGVHDFLVRTFHQGTKGINGSSAPTERKILEEDQQLPCDEYAYLISELWFALRKYIEFGFLKISPMIPQDPLVNELTGRRFLIAGKKTKVESKKEYKSRGNKSPDRADALTYLVHVVRMQLGGPVSATRAPQLEEDRTDYGGHVGVTDRRDYL